MRFQIAATLLGAIILSYFELLRIPMYWPLLVMYFLVVFVAMFKQRITHMIQYGYLPFDLSKKKYTSESKRKTNV